MDLEHIKERMRALVAENNSRGGVRDWVHGVLRTRGDGSGSVEWSDRPVTADPQLVLDLIARLEAADAVIAVARLYHVSDDFVEALAEYDKVKGGE